MESYIKITATVPKPDGSGDVLTKVGREGGTGGGREEGVEDRSETYFFPPPVKMQF